MKMKITAVAVAAALAAPMAAQADVRVGGLLQAEIASMSYDSNVTGGVAPYDRTALVDNQNGRLFVGGDEDLGNGLKAIFWAEWKVFAPEGGQPNNGDASKAGASAATASSQATDTLQDAGREAYVGLKGGWGEFTAGNLKSPYKYTSGVNYDTFVATTLSARQGSFNKDAGVIYNGGAMSGGVYGHGGFVDRSIAYKNKWGGFSLWALYSPDDSGQNTDGDLIFSAGFSGGNWEVTYSNAHAEGCTAAASATDACLSNTAEYDAQKVGASFKIGNHTIRGTVESTESKATPAATTSTDVDYMYLNYQLGFGNNALDVAYGTRDQNSTNGNGDGTWMRVGLEHKMSKNTRVFVGYAEMDFDSVSTGSQSNDYSSLSAGMTIKF